MLSAAETDWREILSVTAYHVGDMRDHADKISEMRKKYWPTAPFPAWTSVQVEGLWYSDAVFEMVVTARPRPCRGVACDD